MQQHTALQSLLWYQMCQSWPSNVTRKTIREFMIDKSKSVNESSTINQINTKNILYTYCLRWNTQLDNPSDELVPPQIKMVLVLHNTIPWIIPMGILMVTQITSLTSAYSTAYSCANQRKHQSSASVAFVRGIHRWQVNSSYKWPVTRKMFPFDDVIVALWIFGSSFGGYFNGPQHFSVEQWCQRQIYFILTKINSAGLGSI